MSALSHRRYINYCAGFGLPALMLAIAWISFISARSKYTVVPPTGSVLAKFFGCVGFDNRVYSLYFHRVHAYLYRVVWSALKNCKRRPSLQESDSQGEVTLRAAIRYSVSLTYGAFLRTAAALNFRLCDQSTILLQQYF